MVPEERGFGSTGGLAKWRGDEYILSFLFANRLQFRRTEFCWAFCCYLVL